MDLTSSEDLLIAGNVCSLIQLWYTGSGKLVGVLRSNTVQEEEINVISALATHPEETTVFLSGGRDGHICIWDLRCGNPLLGRFSAHGDKISSLEYDERGVKVLSSGRDSVIRLWDMRKIKQELEGNGCLQMYTGHVTQAHWVAAHYLYHDHYILTGSETNQAFIYETLTGKVAKTLSLGSSKVVLTAPVPDSVSFYYINYSTQTIALCDTEGESPLPQVQTPSQITHNFHREIMQEVMLDYSDLIISQLNRMNALNSTGLHRIIETLSRSEDTEARNVLAMLMMRYEERVRDRQTELMRRIQGNSGNGENEGNEEIRRKRDAGASAAPSVQVEVTYERRLPGLIPEDSEAMDVDEEVGRSR